MSQTSGLELAPARRVAALGTAAGLALVLLAAGLTWALVHRELDFDEADYLCIARSIARTGLPYITTNDDLGRPQLFVTSPPLAMLVAAATQAAWPSRELPSRLVHAVLFAMPIYLLVWHIARRQFGPWPAAVAVLVLVTNPLVLFYGACVRPDSPLTLFCLLSLWCFHRALEPEGRAWGWSAAAGLSLAAAVWAKYQSVCVPAAILFYLVYLLLRRDRAVLRRAVRPLAAMACAGVLALAALYLYLGVFAGPVERYSFGGIAGSFHQVTAPSANSAAALKSYAWVVALGAIHVGWPGLLALYAAVPDARKSPLLPLLVCFCLATVLFNFAVHNSPGAGAWYMAPMVPAVAILCGQGVSAALARARTAAGIPAVLTVAALLGLQVKAHAPWDVPLPGAYANPPREAGLYIAGHSPAAGGVLADTSAVEFYADRPTARIQFTSAGVVLEYLAGGGPRPVSHVFLRKYGPDDPPPNLAPVWDRCRQLLDERFQPVPLESEGVLLFERRPGSSGP